MTDTDLSTVTVAELREILRKVGVKISETTLRKLMADGTIAHREVTLPLHTRPIKLIPATEVDRLLSSFGERWPRDAAGNGLLDPVGYLERKGRPNIIKEGEE